MERDWSGRAGRTTLSYHDTLGRRRNEMYRYAVLFLTLAACSEDGFVPIFDGKSLTGWQLVKGFGRGYVVEDGKLVCPLDGGGNLFTDKEFSNFVLRFEFRTEPGGNNGIGIRSPLSPSVSRDGMEIQIL